MAYFTQEDIKLFLSPDIFDRFFGSSTQDGWGGLPFASGSAKFEMLAEQASGYVDAFFEPAGYTTPLDPVSHFVKRCAMYRFIIDVYSIMDETVPEGIRETAARNESILHDIATGKISSPANASSTETGVGGFAMSPVTGSAGGLLSKDKLWGSYY